MSINKLLEQLASNNSRKFKEELLTSNSDNNDLVRVINLALNPMINFYIRKSPACAFRLDSGCKGLSWGMSQLDDLINREVTGHAAIEHLTTVLEQLSADDAEVIKKIIARDLRCGVSESTVNKVWKGLIPEFPYMRCCLPKHTDLTKFTWKEGVFSQLKADGMFANINHLADGEVSILSRSGREFPMHMFIELSMEIKTTLSRGTQTHGEVLVKRDGVILPREIGNGIINSVLNGGTFGSNEYPMLMVWDQIPIEQVFPGNKYNVTYDKRYKHLYRQLHDDNTPILLQMIDTRIVHSMEEAMEHYAEVLAAGYEGTIVKNGSAIWEDTTSKNQVKFKLVIDVDLEVVGFTEGNGKNKATFGSITAKTSDGLLVVNVSGFKDKKQKGILTRSEIHEIRDQLIGTIMTVKFNNMMKPTKTNPVYSLFLPRFSEFRADKKLADTLPQVIEQFENAIKGK